MLRICRMMSSPPKNNPKLVKGMGTHAPSGYSPDSCILQQIFVPWDGGRGEFTMSKRAGFGTAYHVTNLKGPHTDILVVMSFHGKFM